MYCENDGLEDFVIGASRTGPSSNLFGLWKFHANCINKFGIEKTSRSLVLKREWKKRYLRYLMRYLNSIWHYQHLVSVIIVSICITDIGLFDRTTCRKQIRKQNTPFIGFSRSEFQHEIWWGISILIVIT